jgi:hypothetical protein
MVLYQSGDPAEASIYQRKAVIINERIQGLDHHETAQAYVSTMYNMTLNFDVRLGKFGPILSQDGKSRIGTSIYKKGTLFGTYYLWKISPR